MDGRRKAFTLIEPFDSQRSLRTRQQKRCAFTLIELLVVIAILALLLTILMPTLARAKELAQQMICLSNQRQLAAGMVVYACASEFMLPGQSGVCTNDSWPNVWDRSTSTGLLARVAAIRSPSAWLCPNDGGWRGFSKVLAKPTTDDAFDGKRTHYFYSYTMFGPLAVNTLESPRQSKPRSLRAFKRPGDTLAFGEEHSGLIDLSLYVINDQLLFGSDMTEPRHGEMSTGSFLDGHAELIPALLQPSWDPQWDPWYW
jgi:prepilin-type N-terminal cleavage/methylation domain-containing protein/prepilin-type processing-associated H-X9-DG protein